MDNYDVLYFQQFAPLIVVQIPENEFPYDTLTKNLSQFDVGSRVWDNSILKNRLLNTKFLINTIKSSEKIDITKFYEEKIPEKHSIISPFNTKSELFPNGILSSQWLKKYVLIKPFVFITFFTLPTNSEEDEQLSKTINDLRLGFDSINIKFVAIIISNNSDVDDDNIRIARIRQVTTLNRISGLLYVNATKDTYVRDCELLITSLVSNLKTPAIDFYSAIETKIRNRYKKYYSIPSANTVDTTIELTPKLLETRNLIKHAFINQFTHPHNLEGCIKPFEVAYTNLIEIVTTNFFEFTKDQVSNHDLKMYHQFRYLIDVLAFHIVRAYLSIEEPITALEKHSTHIANVVSNFDGKIELNEWISVQYKWLGELLLLIPPSILTNNNITSYKKKNKKNNVLGFPGGVRLQEGDFYDIVYDPSMIFLKSVYYLDRKDLLKHSQLDFINNIKDQSSLKEFKLDLLTKACNSSSFITAASNNNKSFVKYIYYLLAQEYYDMEQSTESLQNAIAYYKMALIDEDDGWSLINGFILNRLLICYKNSGLIKENLSTLFSLSTEGYSCNQGELDLDVLDYEQLDLATIRQQPFFDLQSLLVDENTIKGIQEPLYVHDKFVCQLILRPLLNLKKIKNYIKNSQDCSVFLNVDQIDIKFKEVVKSKDSFKTVSLVHDSNKTPLIFHKLDNINTEKSLNVKFCSEDDPLKSTRIVEFCQPAEKSGKVKLEEVIIHSTIEIKLSQKTLIMKNQETIQEPPKLPFSQYVKYDVANENMIDIPLSIRPSEINLVNVLPVKPQVSTSLVSSSIKFIVMGEKLELPFKVDFLNHEKLANCKVCLAPKIKIICNEDDETPLINSQIYWDGLKDDEALDLNNLSQGVYKLLIGIHNSSLQSEEILKASGKTFKMFVELKTLVIEENGVSNDELMDSNAITTYDTADFVLPILNTPFDSKFSISPRVRDEGVNDIPCPFILHDNEHDGLSMPISTRSWMGNLKLEDKFEDNDDIDESLVVEKISYDIRSSSPDILVDFFEDDQEGQDKDQQRPLSKLFTTRSKNGFSHRNVTMLILANIHWTRKGTGRSYELTPPEWEIMLPLADPRVLLQLTKPKSDEKLVKLKYIIENPTPRIFTFSTKLVDENDRFIWNFDDDRNMFPLVQQRFPVLPFNQFVLEYYSSYNVNNEEIVQLPQLKVVDVHYKVNLPTLPVAKDIIIKDNILHWKVRD